MNIDYVGIDYHTKFAVATRMNKDGDIISTNKIDNTKEDIRGYLSTLPSGTKVALESTGNWYAFCEWAYGLPLDIVLSHPQKTRVIAESRIKTDAIDSKVLADLLRTNYLPQSYLAPAEVRDIRELIRFRTTLVRMKALFETKIYNAVYKNGEKITAARADGRKARGELAKMDFRPVYQGEIKSCLAICDYFKIQIKKYDEEVERKATMDEDCKLLMTIPGISFFAALLITSELGDWRRFPSSRKLASYAGLVPSTYSSGGRTRHGSITKQGSKNLRFILLQAITHLARRDSRFGKMYTRIKIKHGSKTARIAVSRKLLCVIFAMLRSRQPFQITKDRQHRSAAQSVPILHRE